MEVNDDQKLFLELVLEHFRRTSEWPVVREIQRQIVRLRGQSVDLVKVIERLPKELWPYSVHLHNEATLNARALDFLGAQEELEDLLIVVKLAAARYQSAEPEPSISAEELRHDWGMSTLRVNKVHRLLRMEPFILGGGHDGDDFELQVSEHAHIFVGVEDIDAYFEAADHFRNPPADPKPVPTEPAVMLEGRQLAVFRALGERLPELAPMYLGAVSAAPAQGNPESLVHAAHSIRELLEKLPAFLDVDAKAHREQMGEKVRHLEGDWLVACKESGCNKDGKWSGDIDGPLGKFLNRTQSFFEWFAEHFPRRRAEVTDVLRRLDASGRRLPEQIEKHKVSAWMDMRGFFQGVSHHTTTTNDEEFLQWLAALEEFLIDHLKPRTFEEQERLDALIRQGEGHG